MNLQLFWTYKKRATSLNIAKIINAPTINAPPVYIKFSVFSVKGLRLSHCFDTILEGLASVNDSWLTPPAFRSGKS